MMTDRVERMLAVGERILGAMDRHRATRSRWQILMDRHNRIMGALAAHWAAEDAAFLADHGVTRGEFFAALS